MKQSKPNILFIFTDQHRLEAVGCYGETPCRTPNIDRLASEGVRFETAYTACPVCSPARGAIITGQYPHTNGIISNVEDLGCCVQELRDRPSLLPRRLQAAGYQCGYTGKWHLGTPWAEEYVPLGTSRIEGYQGPDTPALPRHVGFVGQNFPGHGGGGFKFPEYKEYLKKNNWPSELNGWPHGTYKGPVESTVPYFLTDHTISLIDTFTEAEDPFLIWHNFWGPHGPYFSTQKHVDMYRDVTIPPWPNFRWKDPMPNMPHEVKRRLDAEDVPWEQWAESIIHYYAFTSLIDDQIGRIIEHLRAKGILDNTIVVFSADHGNALGCHGGMGDKGWSHFEEAQRIPLIVRMPESWTRPTLERGTVRGEFIAQLDLHPTFLDMAGAKYDETTLAGKSFLPIIEGKDPKWRDTVFVEFHGVNGMATNMITARHKDIKYGWNVSATDELYDLERDPYEMTNLVSDPAYADILGDMRRRMAEWMDTTDYAPMVYGHFKRQYGMSG